MDSNNFWIVFLVLGLVASVGMGSMIWAYQGAGSVTVIFREVVPLSEGQQANLSEEMRSSFQRGVSEYCRGQYRRSAGLFAQVLKGNPEVGEAWHNSALCLANQREITKATRAFLTAAEVYTKVGDRASAELVKQHLQLLKRKVKPEAVKPEAVKP